MMDTAVLTDRLEQIERRMRELQNASHLPEGSKESVACILSDLNDLSGLIKSEKPHAGSAEQDAHHENEQSCRPLFDGMTEGVALHEIIFGDHGEPVDCRFLDVNPAFAQMVGSSRGDIIGQLTSQALLGDDPFWRQVYSMEALSGTGTLREGHSSALQMDFEIRSFFPRADQFAIILTNITRRKQAEEALRTREQYLSQQLQELDTIYKTSPVGLFSMDRDYRFRRVNEALAAINGVSVEETVGRSLDDILPDKAHILRDIWSPLFKSGTPIINREIHEARRDLLGNYYPVINTAGEVTGLIGAVMDITTRFQLERESNRNATRSEVLLSAIEKILAAADLEELFSTVTAAACQITGGTISAAVKRGANHKYEFIGAHLDQEMSPDLLQKMRNIDASLANQFFIVNNSLRISKSKFRQYRLQLALPEDHPVVEGLLCARMNDMYGAAIGMILVSDRQEGDFSAEDEAALVELAALSSLAYQLIESHNEAEKHANELDTVLNSMLDAVIVYDADYKVVRVNRSASKTYDINPEKETPQAILNRLNITLPDGRKAAVEDMPGSNALKGSPINNSQFLIQMPGRERRNIEATSSPILTKGKISGAVSVWHDVTQREKLLGQLFEERQLWQKTVENMPDQVIIGDANGISYYWNAAANDAFSRAGHPPEANLAKERISEYFQLYHPDGRIFDVNELPMIRAAMYKHEVRDCEIWQHSEDGKYNITLWNASPLTDAAGNVTGAVAVGRDVTEQRQAQEALEQSEARYHRILDTANEGIATIDGERTISYINHRGAQMFDLQAEEMIGHHYRDFIPYRNREEIQANITIMISPDETTQAELKMPKKDGSDCWIQFSIIPIVEDKKNPSGILAVFSDITERIQSERQIASLARFPEENPSPMLRVSADGRLQYANGASRGLLNGWKCQIGDFLPDDLRSKAVEALAKGKDLEVLFHLKDKYFSFIFVPIIESNYVNLYGRDITEREKANRALQKIQAGLEKAVEERTVELVKANTTLRNQQSALSKSELKYRQLVETIQEGVWTIDRDGKTTFVNRALANLLEYNPEEMLGKSIFEFIDEKSGNSAHEILDLHGQGAAKNSDLELISKTGKHIYCTLDIGPMIDDQGEYGGIIAGVMDITRRKLAEESLRQALAYNRSLIETALDPIVIITLDGKVSDANAATEMITGLARDELIGADFLSFFMDPEKALSGFRQLIETGSVHNYELDIRRNDGVVTPVLYNANLYRNVDGEIVGGLAVARNISERRRVENALINSEKLLRTVLNILPAGIWIMDKNGAILEENETGREIWAGSLKDKPGQPFHLKSWLPDTKKKILHKETAVYKALYNSESTINKELEIEDFSGKRKIILNSSMPLVDSKSNISGAVVMNLDITARKQAEIALIAEQQRLLAVTQAERSQRQFAEGLASATLALNSSLDVNEVLDLIFDNIQAVIPFQAAAIYMLEGEMVTTARRRGFSETPEMAASLDQPLQRDRDFLIRRLLEENQPFQIDDTHNTPGWSFELGTEWIRSAVLAPMMYSNKVLGVISLFSDRPGFFSGEVRKRLAAFAGPAAIAIQNARLYRDLQNALVKEQSMRNQAVQTEKFSAMGRMLGSIAHELNNPLQTIKNCLFLIRQDMPDSSGLQEYLAMASSETKRLSNLVAQLREIYRPHDTDAIQWIDVASLVDEIHNLLQPHMMNENVQWVQERSDEQFFVRCAADGLKQVFLNIGMNAIEAMQPAGGSLFVDLHRSADGNQVEIDFRDTGQGIPEEKIANIFDPFFTTKATGLGLGLSICYDIVARHSGQISVKSNPGEGAAFTVSLPAADKNKSDKSDKMI